MIYKRCGSGQYLVPHAGFRSRTALVLLSGFLASVLTVSCEGGLAPPDVPPVGSISGSITYSGTWPSADSLDDLRFVAMRFIPIDTSDFLQLNQMEISATLLLNVDVDSFLIENVVPGAFFYSGVAQKFSDDILAWRPVGLVEEDGGVFDVKSGARTHVFVAVDFGDPPPFPPEAQ